MNLSITEVVILVDIYKKIKVCYNSIYLVSFYMVLKRIIGLVFICVLAALVCVLPSVKATYDYVDLPNSVSQNPADWTPEVPGTWSDGTQSSAYEVRSLVPLGAKMYAGGNFPLVKSADGASSYERGNIFAFDAKTGEVDEQFVPKFDKPVSSIVPSADGTSLYVGGEFKKLNGAQLETPFIAKIDATTGQLVSGFKAPQLNAKVNDLDLVRGNLIIGGKFTIVDSLSRIGLISVNESDGKLNNYINVQMKHAINATSPVGVARFAVNAGKTKMAVAGSFKNVDGQDRKQLFILNLNKDGDALANWDAPILHNEKCSLKSVGNAVVIEDLDFNTEGTKLFLATGGGPNPGICDAAVKFDITLKGDKVKPDWVSKTHFDTLRSIEWTSGAVYVAGHQKQLKSSDGVFVDRPGIGALDPKTGLALSWNPGKGREIGSKELIITNSANQPSMPTGLWVGSDSGGCGINIGEISSHQGICFFPSL